MGRRSVSQAFGLVRLDQHAALWGGSVALGLLGLCLRVDGVNTSLWLDEFGTFWVVERDLWTAFDRSWQFQGQSPFYYVVAWSSLHAFGESEFALRAPSLLFGCLLPGVLFAAGRMLGGARAGVYAALLGWLSVPLVRASAEARPYALALFFVALAVAAFQVAVRSGNPWARALWIVSGAAAAYSHYVEYVVVVGLFVSYACVPALRTRYSARRFALDGLWHVMLVGACAPQVFALAVRRETLSWVDATDYVGLISLPLPFLPALALGKAVDDPAVDHTSRALRQSLWICLGTHLLALEVAALGGARLLVPRYLLATLVPIVLLAATRLARLRPGGAVASAAGFALVTAGGLAAAKVTSGHFTGIGSDDWRGAVAALSTRLERVPGPLVLFRSGFVEEDMEPLGAPPPATLAPLRSPGCAAFRWPVRSLTFRWSNPGRQEYFDRVIARSVEREPRFFVLSATWSPGGANYASTLATWVQRKWPGRYQLERTAFGGVELLEFRRRTS